MARISRILTLGTLLVCPGCWCTEFNEESEARRPTPHTAHDDYPGQEQGDHQCSTVINLADPSQDTVDYGAAGRTMSMLLYEVSRPELYDDNMSHALGDFTTSDQLYQALQMPTMNHTVLVPPQEQLMFLSNALEHDLLTHEQMLHLLLLHIIPGRFSMRDFTLAAQDGLKLETVSGKLLNIEDLSSNIRFSYGDSDATVVGNEDLASCKTGSVVHHVDDMLSNINLQQLRDYHNAHVAEEQAIAAQQEEQRNPERKMSTGALVLLILGLVIGTPCCCFMWKKWGQSLHDSKDDDSEMEAIESMHANHMKLKQEKVLPFAQWMSTEPVSAQLPAAPKVLYRMDGNIWSIMPPCSPRSSSFRRIQMQDFTTFDDAAQLESDRENPFDGRSTDFAAPTSTTCTICCNNTGDHVLLPCGHGGYCGTCAQSLLAKKGKSCAQCPICRAPLTAIVKVPADTPVGSSGNVLEVSTGSLSSSRVDFNSTGPEPQDEYRKYHGEHPEQQMAHLLGPKVTVNPTAEFATYGAAAQVDLLGPKLTINPIAELPNCSSGQVDPASLRLLRSNMPNTHAYGAMKTQMCLQSSTVPAPNRVSIDKIPKEDSSMEGVASFIVWEEQASEAGTSSGSRG